MERAVAAMLLPARSEADNVKSRKPRVICDVTDVPRSEVNRFVVWISPEIRDCAVVNSGFSSAVLPIEERDRSTLC